MALLFIDSFDNYNSPTIGILGKWQSEVISTATLSIAAGLGRNGGAAFGFSVAGLISAGGAYMQGVLKGSALARVVIGFAINVTSFDPTTEMPIFQFVDTGTPQVCMLALPNGQIRFRSGDRDGTVLSTSTTSVLNATGVYQYLELDITLNSSTGALVLHKNNVNVALSASSSLNTAPSGTNSFNTYRMGMPGTGAATINYHAGYLFDDFYMLSTSGGDNTTFLGDVRAVCVFPNGAGSSTQLTPNGAVDNWQCVNQTSEDGDTTYVSSSTVGNKDLYTKQPTPSNTGQIFGIQLCSVARKDDAGSRSCINTVLSGSTPADGATQQVSEQYAWYLDVLEQDPAATSAWTKTTLDAATVGVKVGA